MPGVAHVLSVLRGPLVLPCLQPNLGVAHAPYLLLAEVALVLGRHLGAQPGAGVLRVVLGLVSD